MKGAFIYRRATMDSQDNHTLEQQETACRNYSKENGLIIVEVFREAGGEPRTSPSENTQEQ